MNPRPWGRYPSNLSPRRLSETASLPQHRTTDDIISTLRAQGFDAVRNPAIARGNTLVPLTSFGLLGYMPPLFAEF